MSEGEARLERLYDALETGKFNTDELAPRIRTLVARKAPLQGAKDDVNLALRAKGLEIEDVEVMRCYVQDLRALLGSVSIMEQKAFLKSFVKGLDVSNSKVTVNYTLPMPPANSDKETVGVLAFILYGDLGRMRTSRVPGLGHKIEFKPESSFYCPFSSTMVDER